MSIIFLCPFSALYFVIILNDNAAILKNSNHIFLNSLYVARRTYLDFVTTWVSEYGILENNFQSMATAIFFSTSFFIFFFGGKKRSWQKEFLNDKADGYQQDDINQYFLEQYHINSGFDKQSMLQYKQKDS